MIPVDIGGQCTKEVSGGGEEWSVRAAEGETNTKGVHDKEHMGGVNDWVEKQRDILETRTL